VQQVCHSSHVLLYVLLLVSISRLAYLQEISAQNLEDGIFTCLLLKSPLSTQHLCLSHLVQLTSCLTEVFVTCRMAARPLMCTQGQKQQAQSEGARLGVILNKVKHQDRQCIILSLSCCTMVPFLHSFTSYKLNTFSRRFGLTALLPCFQNPLACSLTLQRAACTHTCMLPQGPSEAFKHTGSNKSTEGQRNTASHDSTSGNTALGSESSKSSELDSTLAGQVIDPAVEGAGRAGTSASGMSHDLDPSCAGHLADGVAQAPGRTDASRSTAEDRVQASKPAAEPSAILASLPLCSRYVTLLMFCSMYFCLLALVS